MADSLFDNALVWDAHAGFETRSAVDLEPLQDRRDAGVNFLSVNVGYDVNVWHDTVKALAVARDWLHVTDGYRLIGNVRELDQAVAAGEMAVAFDIEGANALDGRVDMVRFYYDLGVRQLLLAYNLNNLAAGGCHDEDDGLSAFGYDIVAAMNGVGMLVDCSHCGYRTTMDVMSCSSDPVIFSHSNVRALCDHERNIRDDQALRCAETGGVVGVNGISRFVGDDDTRTTSIVDHIDYLLDLLGDAHVGIGLDYFFEDDTDTGFNDVLLNNAHFWPEGQYPDGAVGCAHPRQLIEVTQELLRRGRSERTVRGVLGENFARVASIVWGR